MGLIFILVPCLFFILCLLEVQLSGGNVSLGLPKHWEKKSAEDDWTVDGLCGLEFISETPLDLNSLRIRARYVYIKGR